MTFNEGPYQERSEAVIETPSAHTIVQQQSPGNLVATPMASTRVRRASSSRFEPDALIAAIVGLALLLLGLIAVVRGGFDGDMSDPVVEVLGFAHTTTLGLIEIALGVALLIAGATRSRSGATFFGAVLGIVGFVAAVQSASFDESLAVESSMGWLAVLAGLVVVLSALMMPRFAKHSSVVENV
jgi:peptidoglycan/LPS O-acetylase OafA/YrhL